MYRRPLTREPAPQLHIENPSGSALPAGARAFANFITPTPGAFHAFEFVLPGKAQASENGKDHHEDEKHRDDFKHHASETEPGPKRLLFD